MLSINNSYERHSKEYLALTEISKTFTSRLELPQLLAAVIKKIFSAVKQADISALMLWGQFKETSQENLNALITTIARTYASSYDPESLHKTPRQLQASLMYLMKSQAVCA